MAERGENPFGAKRVAMLDDRAVILFAYEDRCEQCRAILEAGDHHVPYWVLASEQYRILADPCGCSEKNIQFKKPLVAEEDFDSEDKANALFKILDEKWLFGLATSEECLAELERSFVRG